MQTLNLSIYLQCFYRPDTQSNAQSNLIYLSLCLSISFQYQLYINVYYIVSSDNIFSFLYASLYTFFISCFYAHTDQTLNLSIYLYIHKHFSIHICITQTDANLSIYASTDQTLNQSTLSSRFHSFSFTSTHFLIFHTAQINLSIYRSDAQSTSPEGS